VRRGERVISLSAVAILFEVIVWVYLFLRFSKDLGYWKAMIFADFIVTTLDFVLMLTPLHTTIFSVYVIQRQTQRVIMVIPITLGMLIMLKSFIFYLSHELFPDWMRSVKEVVGGEQGEEAEE